MHQFNSFNLTYEYFCSNNEHAFMTYLFISRDHIMISLNKQKPDQTLISTVWPEATLKADVIKYNKNDVPDDSYITTSLKLILNKLRKPTRRL